MDKEDEGIVKNLFRNASKLVTTRLDKDTRMDFLQDYCNVYMISVGYSIFDISIMSDLKVVIVIYE